MNLENELRDLLWSQLGVDSVNLYFMVLAHRENTDILEVRFSVNKEEFHFLQEKLREMSEECQLSLLKYDSLGVLNDEGNEYLCVAAFGFPPESGFWHELVKKIGKKYELESFAVHHPMDYSSIKNKIDGAGTLLEHVEKEPEKVYRAMIKAAFYDLRSFYEE